MFVQNSALESVDFGGVWNLPDLTNADNMFHSCTSLKTIDLFWTGIQAMIKEDGNPEFTIYNMFYEVPDNAVLNICYEEGDEGEEKLSVFMEAVI